MKHAISPLAFDGALLPPHFLSIIFGFLFSFLAFLIGPIFLSSHVMQYFNYVPSIDPIGVDLKQVLTSTKFVLAGRIPYGITKNLYPPLTYLLFRPMLQVNLPARYAVLTVISFAAYGVANFAFPRWIGKGKRVTASLMLVFVTGLFSYGFQFELERGQFNVIAVLMLFLAIWIYHRHPDYRGVAYVLFTVAVQLKLYPCVFIVMLIHDWRDWRNNIRRLAVLAVANLGLLFIMGPDMFTEFASAVRAQSGSADWIWVGNHSVQGFVALALRDTAAPYRVVSAWVLSLVVLACTFFIAIQAYRRNAKGMDPYLLLACSMASLLLPAISNDYTLATLAGPVAIVLSGLEDAPKDYGGGRHGHVSQVIVICLFSAAYSATLFSYTNKPYSVYVANDLLALMVMLLTLTLMSTWPKQGREEFPSPATVQTQALTGS